MTGIDMPQQTVNSLRQQLEGALARLEGRSRICLLYTSRCV